MSIKLIRQYATEEAKQPEQLCKFCGGYLIEFRCLYENCELFGKRFRTSGELTRWCEKCKCLLHRKALTNPCPDCVKNEPDTVLKRFDRLDKDALKVELGKSESGLEEFCSEEDASHVLGEDWQGYRIEIFGYKAGRYSEWHLPAEFFEAIKTLPDDLRQQWETMHPFNRIPFPCIMIPEDPDLIIRLCRLRARYKSSPLYAEMRAHNYGVRRVAIQGLEHQHTKKDLDAAIKGLDLLRKVNKKLRGRKRGNRKYSKPAFIKLARQKWQAFNERFDKDPRDYELAEEMNLSRTAFYDHMADYELQMSGLRARAMLL